MPTSFAALQERPATVFHRFAAVQQVLGLLLMVFSLTMLPPLA